ncbi:hypothetical protein RND71_003624 [Anisodus tanguticus]|uniref:Uncharacterized protein n=1 Tax=Anisodus tanguticus TaxID=243964 RepID=A0AAE1SX48_9SOLA|nr:hypothetical protein RND71_003624 [Anisodus tanguticus]
MTKVVTTSYGVSLWRSIRVLWNEFKLNTKIKVANGAKIEFWKDVWHEAGNMKSLFPDIHNSVLHQQRSIADHWTPQGCSFNFRRQLNDWKISRMVNFLSQ